MCRGDVLLKKTLVLFGSMFSSTHLDHVLRTLSYAIGRGTSSYSVDPSSNDPRLLLHHTRIHKLNNFLRNYETLKKGKKINYHLCLQDFHSESVHPPNIGVEDQEVCILPIHSMLFDGFRHDYTVQYAVHVWIIWIWLYEEWCPIEFHSGNMLWLLHKNKPTT